MVHVPQDSWVSHTSHPLAPNDQCTQLPDVGPVPLPASHWPRSSHQPQPAAAVHEPHAKLLAHGSGAAHVVQSHVAQLPAVGPLLLPLTQLLVPSHHPQPLAPRHVSQPMLDAHGSAAWHMNDDQSHVLHAPPAGPALVPVRQLLLLGHHPQLLVPVQVPHVNWLSHGSFREHALLNQRQSPQLPAVGPVAVPPLHATSSAQ